MAKPLPTPFDKQKVVAENRRARFDYFVEERFEAGIQLAGTEVKALRQGEGSIAESYATVEGDERSSLPALVDVELDVSDRDAHQNVASRTPEAITSKIRAASTSR